MTEAERLAQALERAWELAPFGIRSLQLEAAAELRRLSADAQRYAWLREGERKRLGAAVTGGGRLIAKDKLRALMEFNFWCSPKELDAAIDQARKDTP